MRQTLSQDDMPSRSTVYLWLDEHDDFRTRIAHARKAGYDERFEKAVDDAKKAPDAALGRLAFNAEQWFLAKIDPKRFGDKAEVHHTGAVAAPTVALSDDPNEAARQYRDLISGISEE